MPRTSIEDASLQGWARLASDAILGLTAIVEGMHRNISPVQRLLGSDSRGTTRGLTGVVYWSIRSVTRLVGMRLFEAAFSRLAAAPGARPTTDSEVTRGILNGIVGDHLAATGNRLAISMQLRHDGQPLPFSGPALRAVLPRPGAKVLMLVHGLGATERQWARAGHDHGAALARDLGYTPIYLRYNTGLHVSTNGRSFACVMEQLVRGWPCRIQELTVLAHSMGGLVTRSACEAGTRLGHRWLRELTAIVFLGTPHHGTPLERGGSWIDAALGLSSYSSPLSGLGKIRSGGITDLRHGSLLDEDWHGRDRFAFRSHRPRAVPLPRGVRCHAIAGATSLTGALGAWLVGDGLVTIDSALGRHADPEYTLDIPEARRWIARGVGHNGLLGDPAVYHQIRRWLA
jgi:pimeloyl-ACP methyl ester carboxylesterase